MAKPVYKLFLGKPKPSWYKLSNDEQEKFLANLRTLLEEVGAKTVVMCNCAWSNEQWFYFGVEEFPDIEAVQRHSELIGERNWPFEFGDNFSILGTRMN